MIYWQWSCFLINNKWNAYRQAIYSQRCQHRLGDQGCCALEPDDWLKDWQWSNSYYLSGNFTLSELNTCGLICFLSRCLQGRQKEGERVSRKMEDWGIEKKNSIKWPKRVINNLVISRTTFAASERRIQIKLKQKRFKHFSALCSVEKIRLVEKEKQAGASTFLMRWAVVMGGGGDHQSPAQEILCAAAEGAYCFLGGREGERAEAIGRENISRNNINMSFQVSAVEEGGRRVIEESWRDIEEEMIVSSKREQTKRWADIEGNGRRWAGWEEQRFRERQIDGGRVGE